MNMVYLVTETRVKVGERGINDPSVKIIVTLFTYAGLSHPPRPKALSRSLLTAYCLLLTTYYFQGLIFLNQKDFVDPSKVPTKELPEIEIELSSGEVQAKIRDWALPLQVSRW